MPIILNKKEVSISQNDQSVAVQFDTIYKIKKNKNIREYEYSAISSSFTSMLEEQLKLNMNKYFKLQPFAPYRNYMLDWMRIISWIESDPTNIQLDLKNKYNINI